MSVYGFSELEDAPLVIDAIYESKGTLFGEGPLNTLLPKAPNQGGFRTVKRLDKSGNAAYIILYTSLEEIEWPDSLDTETGVLRYYGDNRTPGKDLHDTPKRGNQYLKDVYASIDQPELRKNIPPFLIFQKTGKAFDVKFLGVAVPGNPNITPDRELNALWRTKQGSRFQNYEAYFTILDTQDQEISKDWLSKLIFDHENSLSLAPKAWRRFIGHGRSGIKPLVAPKQLTVPNKESQYPKGQSDVKIIQKIRKYYESNPFGFEQCATAIVQMMDNNFEIFELTRPWRDGGRDATGKYRIGSNQNPLIVECALEAKCYAAGSGVGVKPMSRLISRIKHRQFGILVTTSHVESQAYKEIVEDGHPILIINASDIADILRTHGIGVAEIEAWLRQIEINRTGFIS